MSAFAEDFGFDEFEHCRPDCHSGLEYPTGALVPDRVGNEARFSPCVLPIRIGPESAHDRCTTRSGCFLDHAGRTKKHRLHLPVDPDKVMIEFPIGPDAGSPAIAS